MICFLLFIKIKPGLSRSKGAAGVRGGECAAGGSEAPSGH